MMDWIEVLNRAADEQVTSYVEIIDVINDRFDTASALSDTKVDDPILYEAGLLAASLLWQYDCRDYFDDTNDNEKLDFLSDLTSVDDGVDSEMAHFIRRLVDRNDIYIKAFGEDYEIDTHCFATIQEAREALKPLKQQVYYNERRLQSQKIKEDQEKAIQEALNKPTHKQEIINRFYKAAIKYGTFFMLLLSAYAGIIEHDILVIFITGLMLFQLGLLYGARKNNYYTTLKNLKILLFAFLITTLFMAVIMLIYLGKGVYYLELDKIKPIESLAELEHHFSKQTTTFDEFISGIVSEANSTHINGNDRCVLSAKHRMEHADGSNSLYVDLKDGIVRVDHVKRSKNSQNDFVRLNWEPLSFGMYKKSQCLKIGQTVSIKGNIIREYSIESKKSSYSISANQIYGGNSLSHAQFLRANMPGNTWAIIMGRATFILTLIYFLNFIIHLLLTLQLWLSEKGKT